MLPQAAGGDRSGLCDAEKSKPDSVGRWFSWEAELMESAALEVFGAGLDAGCVAGSLECEVIRPVLDRDLLHR